MTAHEEEGDEANMKANESFFCLSEPKENGRNYILSGFCQIIKNVLILGVIRKQDCRIIKCRINQEKTIYIIYKY